MQYIIAASYFNLNVFLQCDLAVSGEAIQVARNILSGKYASGEMLLQVLNFWRSSTKCNAQKAFCEIIVPINFY